MQRLRADALSPRRRRILDGVAAGKSNGLLAEELGITLDGVKWHVSEMLGETGCSDRHELSEWWRRERAARSAPALSGLGGASHNAVTTAARVAFVVALTAVLVGGIWAGWTCGAATSSGTVVAPGPLGKIAYVEGGDIWVKALPDGEPKRITEGPSASAPKWSASGDWLLYRAANTRRVIGADGSKRRDVPDSAVWSPAADRFAYVDLDGALQVEDADGGKRETVVDAVADATVRRRDIVWAADGGEFAYAEDRRTADADAAVIVASVLWRVAPGQPPEVLYSSQAEETKPGATVVPSLLPIYLTRPGGVLYFARVPGADTADGVIVEAVRLDSHELVQFVGHAPATLLSASEISADTTGRLAIVGAGRESWTQKRVTIVSWQSGIVVDLTDPAVAAGDPTFSPDGRQIAYAAMPDVGHVADEDAVRDGLAQRKLWILGRPAAVDGAFSTTRQLTSDPAYRDEYPQWSDDGSQILFVRMDAQGKASLWMAPADGGDPMTIVDALTPASGVGEAPWLGYFGHVAWDNVLAWWRPRV